MIYFTSDHHMWHANIIRYCNRPFKSVEEMNEKLIQYWNETVKPDDFVYYLGDFAMAFRPLETILPRLHGKKYLVSGNHDFCHPSHKKGRQDLDKWTKKYIDAGFNGVALDSWITIADQKVLMCHFPYATDFEKSQPGYRFPQYRPTNTGLWLLHGHTHGKWKVRDRMIDIGVDSWDYKPVSIDAISAIITEE